MSDKAFREWIQTLPSCIDGKFSEWLTQIGEWRNPACHVRRAGRSGVAFKEDYACIPLTHKQHAYQHQCGELACLVKYARDRVLRAKLLDADPFEAELMAREWFDAQVLQYRTLWLKHTGLATLPQQSRHNNGISA